ncbi:MAG: hypothetical protein J5833_07330 [Victivallales bacterium]|nr:hypothetical protein [Victivallales bacterium]
MASKTQDTEEFYFPELPQKRIAELEAMLPEKPAGMGRPAADRAAWNAIASSPGAQEFIESTEKILDEAYPELPDDLYLEYQRNGNRTHYEKPYGKRMSMVNALTLAECLEHKGRFIPKLEEGLDLLLSQKSWVLPAHDYTLKNFNDEAPFPDLVSSDVACMLAYIDWFLQDSLSKRIRERIRKEAMHRAIAPYQRVYRGEVGKLEVEMFWTVGISNWNAVCTCNMLSACLVLLESRRDRAEALAAMELSNKFFYKGFTADGYCSEGLGYWAYGFGHFLTMAEIVLDATGGRLNIFDDDPVIRKCCEYPRNIMIEDGVAPAYADCSFNGDAGDANLAIIQRHFPELLPKPVVRPGVPSSLDEFQFYLRNLREVAIFGFTDDKPADASAVPPLAPVSFFAEAGVLICRSTDKDGGTFGASIKGGHNFELHNHNDVGSYVIVLDKSPLVADYGGEVYTKRTFSLDRFLSKMLNSYGHDVPVVAGQLQKTGRDAEGVVKKTDFTDDYSFILYDMTSCYDVKELLSLTRRFTFDRVNHTVTVADTVEFAAPQSFEDAIVSNANYCVSSKSRIRFYDGKSSLTADIAVDGADWTVESEFIDNPGRISPTRFAIQLDKPVLKATVQCVFRRG